MTKQFDSIFRDSVKRMHYSGAADSDETQPVHVVIWPTFAGMTDFETGVADRIASMGVSVTAVDLYGQGRNPVEMEAKNATMGLPTSSELMMRAANSKEWVMEICFPSSSKGLPYPL